MHETKRHCPRADYWSRVGGYSLLESCHFTTHSRPGTSPDDEPSSFIYWFSLCPTHPYSFPPPPPPGIGDSCVLSLSVPKNPFVVSVRKRKERLKRTGFSRIEDPDKTRPDSSEASFFMESNLRPP